LDVLLELGAKLGVGDVVNEAFAALPGVHRETSAMRSEMGMVICPIEQVRNAVVL